MGFDSTEDVMEFLLNDVETKNVWKLFHKISVIPRQSKNEKEVIEYIYDFAKKNMWQAEKDSTGNLLIKVQSNSNSKETVCLQAHVDMVCVKNDVEYDFTRDAIQFEIKEEGFVSAKGTTLGADNGIGVAIALALALDNSVAKPNIEILLTVDEETGLTGAKGFEPGRLDSKMLFNLDSEDDGKFSIGCAGGLDCEALTELYYIDNLEKVQGYELVIRDLPGGHSGITIHENHRVNAIQLLAQILLLIDNVQLVSINGGEARNSIPKFCMCQFASLRAEDKIIDIIEEIRQKHIGLEYELKKIDVETFVMKPQTHQILKTLFVMPSNVLEISNTISGLVQTSNNLGVVKTDGNYLKAYCLLRSSNTNSTDRYAHKIVSLFELGDFNAKCFGQYPGWDPEPNSEIVSLTIKTYKDLFGKEPLVEAIHAGLECGLLKGKYRDVEMISLGPTIIGAHTPLEKVSISSVKNTYILMKKILELLS